MSVVYFYARALCGVYMFVVHARNRFCYIVLNTHFVVLYSFELYMFFGIRALRFDVHVSSSDYVHFEIRYTLKRSRYLL